MQSDFRLLPENASTIAGQVDALYLFLVSVAGFFTLLICVLVVYFAIRYRRSARVDRSNPPSSFLLEIGWSIVPLVLSMVMFYWGAVIYFRMYQSPPESDQIYVVGKQWMWKIQHPNGRREINELHIPVNRPVKLKMISEDVIHDFYVPAFRVKQDVLPGSYTHMWFEPTKVGSYHLFCAEYCGTSHSQMIGKVIVMEPADYAAWLGGETSDQPAEVAGQQLFEQFRCDTCHRREGRCPPLDGIYGKTVKLADGTSVVADEEYLRESILIPNEKVVAGYKPVMPTYKGQIGEEGVLQIISYLKTLALNASADGDAASGESAGDTVEAVREATGSNTPETTGEAEPAANDAEEGGTATESTPATENAAPATDAATAESNDPESTTESDAGSGDEPASTEDGSTDGDSSSDPDESSDTPAAAENASDTTTEESPAGTPESSTNEAPAAADDTSTSTNESSPAPEAADSPASAAPEAAEPESAAAPSENDS